MSNRTTIAQFARLACVLFSQLCCSLFKLYGALGMLVAYLYQSWLAENNEQAADFPILLQRKVFFPDVPAHLAQTDILLLLG